MNMRLRSIGARYKKQFKKTQTLVIQGMSLFFVIKKDAHKTLWIHRLCFWRKFFLYAAQ